MAQLGFTQALGRQRAARLRRDVQVIDRALGDAQLSSLAETALHLAAEILERAGGAEAPAPLSPDETDTLARFGIDTSDPMPAEALLRSRPAIQGMGLHAELIASAVPIAEAAARLGVDPSRLRQRIREGTLLALRRPHGRGPDGELPHLAALLGAAQRHLSVLASARAFTLPDDDLGGVSPRDWLISGGDPAPVERIVAGL
jgi:hypothetical protein